MAALRLDQRRVAKPWGRRDLGAPFGAVSGGDEPVGEIWFETPAGVPAPLLVKYLFTSERLSIQVHPDDKGARASGYPSGKDETWLVLAADAGATIGLGLIREVEPDVLRAAALDGSIEQLVDWRPVAAGDVFYSPAGTIHAIGAGLTLIEVQQNVDLTYRLYDYGRPRELHLDAAIEAARPGPFRSTCRSAEIGPGRALLCDGPALRLEKWTGTQSERVEASRKRPAWIIPLAGAAAIADASLEPGEVWLVDAPTELRVEGELLVASQPAQEAGRAP